MVTRYPHDGLQLSFSADVTYSLGRQAYLGLSPGQVCHHRPLTRPAYSPSLAADRPRSGMAGGYSTLLCG